MRENAIRMNAKYGVKQAVKQGGNMKIQAITMRTAVRCRLGLTLIEVLSAMGVATIGVFGVLVLLPLASRMSQIGLSNQATRQNATNVIEKMKSFGALNSNRWVWNNGATFIPAVAMPGDAYCLDPMLISAPNFNPDLPATDTSAIRFFPYTSGAPTVQPTQRLSIRRVPGATLPMGAAMAESMFGQRDLLRTNPAPSDVLPPTQAYVRDPGSGAVVRRETEGSKSALALILPTNQPGAGVQRMMSIVVTNRRFDLFNYDRVFTVSDPFSATPLVVRKPGGVIDLVLDEVDADPDPNNANVPRGNLKSRGWLILVPWYRNAVNVDVYAWQHARPYQIRSSDQDPMNITRFQVSMVGMPYTAPSLTTLGPPYTGNLDVMATRAIYIPDAVDIRESEVRIGTSEY